ncbi:MAG: hypothetical protein R2932_04635 [Caldilineaceae bacterium]
MGIAIRFVGLMAKGQGRQSDWDVLETEQRDQTRQELCRMHGVQLALLDPADDPIKQLDNFSQVLARASRTLAQSDRSHAEKQQWMPALSEARARATKVRSLLGKKPEQVLATLAESWRDREAGRVAALHSPAEPAKPKRRNGKAPVYKEEQRVCHERFGEGVITHIAGDSLTILFDGEQERTFAAELVLDKLSPL